jgi:hypothetical protein
VFRGLPITGAGIAVAMSSRATLSCRGSTCLAVGLGAAMVSQLRVLSGEALVRCTWRRSKRPPL